MCDMYICAICIYVYMYICAICIYVYMYICAICIYVYMYICAICIYVYMCDKKTLRELCLHCLFRNLCI